MAFNVRKLMPNLPNLPSIPHVGPILTNTNALPPGVSLEEQETARRELSLQIDKLVGKVGIPNENATAILDTDRLTAALLASEDSRARLIDQFLRARHGSARDAARMINTALKWRAQVNTLDFMHRYAEILAKKGAKFPMAVISTADACKQPVVYGIMRLLEKRKVEREPFADAVIAFFEHLYFAEEYTQQEMIVILDFRGWSLRKHSPYRVVKDGLHTLQAYYPERLGCVFLVNYPASIRAAYTAISPIIDSGARSKIVWVPDTPCENMKQHGVPPKSIPTYMGGELQARIPTYWPDIAAEWENPELVAHASL